MTRIDPDNRSVEEEVEVGDGPFGIAADSSSVWVANSCSDTVSQIDPSEMTEVRRLDVGSGPLNVVSDDEHVWVTTDGGVVPITLHG